jgi:hypothetical protein
MFRGRRARRASRDPHDATSGLALVLHAAAGVVPFAVVAAAAGGAVPVGGPLAIAGLAVLYFVGTWILFDVTHEAMYGR